MNVFNYSNFAFHTVLFLSSLLFSFFLGKVEDSYYKNTYISVEVWGDVSYEGNLIRVPVRIREFGISKLEGRKALLFVKGEVLPEKRYLLIKGNLRVRDGRIYIWAKAEDIKASGLYTLRDYLMDRYITASGGWKRAGVGPSFLFGEPRDVLDPSVRGDFFRTGLIHFLVISGLHVGMIAFILSLLLPNPYGYLLAIVGVSFYILFVVPSEPPVLRAGLMFLMLIIARLIYRRVNPINTLLFSGSIILFLYPYNLFSLSFWLSFLATLFILLSLKDIEGNIFYRSFIVSLSAFSATSPLISTFSFISPISVLLSPFLTPLVFAYSLTGVLSLLTLFTLKPLVDIFNLLGLLFVKVVNLISDISFLLIPEIGIYEAFFLIILGISGLYFLKGNYKLIPPLFINFWLLIRSF